MDYILLIFSRKGGLDSAVSEVLRERGYSIGLATLGFEDKYFFNVEDREYLHKINGLDEDKIVATIN